MHTATVHAHHYSSRSCTLLQLVQVSVGLREGLSSAREQFDQKLADHASELTQQLERSIEEGVHEAHSKLAEVVNKLTEVLCASCSAAVSYRLMP